MKKEEVPTLGQYRVGVSFNPSGMTGVNLLKQLAATVIDHIRSGNDQEAVMAADKFFEELSIAKGNVKDNPEAVRCLNYAEIYASNSIDSLASLEKETAEHQFEAAAMWAVKGVTKQDVPTSVVY